MNTLCSNRSTKTKLIIGLAALALLAAACGGSDADQAAPGTEAVTTDEGEGDGPVIGFSQRRLAGSDWWATLLMGAEDKAAELGAEIIVTDAGGDTQQQNSDVETLLAQQVDAIIINPHDPTGVRPAVLSMADAGVPFVVVNSNLDEDLAQQQFCYVAEDQVATARGMGEALAEKAIDDFGSDETLKAVVIGGYSGESVTEWRHEGAVEGFQSVPDAPELEFLPIRFGEWLPDRALPQVRDVATANPDLRIVFSLSDVMLPGIKQGLDDAGILDEVLIGTYDGEMRVLADMMEEPDGPVQVNASNEPYAQGQTAVEMAMAAVEGRSQDEVCPGGEHWIDTFLATPENAEEHYDPSRPF